MNIPPRGRTWRPGGRHHVYIASTGRPFRNQKLVSVDFFTRGKVWDHWDFHLDPNFFPCEEILGGRKSQGPPLCASPPGGAHLAPRGAPSRELSVPAALLGPPAAFSLRSLRFLRFSGGTWCQHNRTRRAWGSPGANITEHGAPWGHRGPT